MFKSANGKGVCWHIRKQNWVAQIRYKGHLSHLGYFKTPEAAAKAYDIAAVRLFGEFACLNFPENEKS